MGGSRGSKIYVNCHIKRYEESNQWYVVMKTNEISNRYKLSIDLAEKYLKRNYKCLEIGAGFPEFSKELLRRGHEVAVIDLKFSEARKVDLNQLKILYIEADLDNLEDVEFQPNTYDVVYFLEVIEHLKYPKRSMDFISHVLKPGGLLIMSTPNVANIGNRLKMLFGGSPYSPYFKNFYFDMADFHSHWREYSISEIKKILEEYNTFKILEILYYPGDASPNTFTESLPPNFSEFPLIRIRFIKHLYYYAYRLICMLNKNFCPTIVLVAKQDYMF